MRAGVSVTMALDSILMLALLWSATNRYRWVLITIVCFVLLIEVGFIAGNLLKLPDGGWVPLALGLLLFFIMATWRQGRSALAAKVRRDDFTLAEFQRLIEQVGYTLIHNVSGAPAISLPLGWSGTGLPIGVQFSGALGSEKMLLEIAYELEAATPWIGKRPKVWVA